MSESRVKIAHTYRVSPLLSLTSDLAYARLLVSAPDAARLPVALHAVSLGLRGDFRASPNLSVSAMLAPGLAGDFREIGGDDLRVRFGLTGRYRASEKLTLLGGLIYLEGYRSLPVFPILGAIYRPDERWIVSLAAPRSGVTYAASKELRLYLGAEFFAGEYQLHEPRLGAEVIRYRDFRAVGGANFTVVSGLKGEVALGYVFSREFAFYDPFDATRHDVGVDAGLFGRTGLKMEW